jgi:uncharacterized membrane-anchored protein YhcB (DUF1043 family)
MNNIIAVLVAIIGALVGAVGFLFARNQGNSALLQNTKMKEGLLKQDQAIDQDKAQLNVEQQTQSKLTQDLNKGPDSNETLEEINNFLNSDK